MESTSTQLSRRLIGVLAVVAVAVVPFGCGSGSYDPDDDWQIMLWDWLKTLTAADWDGLPLYLGYGTSDMFNDAQTLLATRLPPEQVFTTPGGHTPKVMRQVWLDYLDAGGLAH